jgi:hypothetical protein
MFGFVTVGGVCSLQLHCCPPLLVRRPLQSSVFRLQFGLSALASSPFTAGIALSAVLRLGRWLPTLTKA